MRGGDGAHLHGVHVHRLAHVALQPQHDLLRCLSLQHQERHRRSVPGPTLNEGMAGHKRLLETQLQLLERREVCQLHKNIHQFAWRTANALGCLSDEHGFPAWPQSAPSCGRQAWSDHRTLTASGRIAAYMPSSRQSDFKQAHHARQAATHGA